MRGAADVYTTLGTATATSTGWVELTGVLAVPSCTLEELAVYLEGPAAGVMLYADDVAVRPQPGELGPNLVANPDFEAGTTGWFGFGGPTLTTTTAQAHGGLRSGLVTNRTAGFQGPATSLLGLVQPGGVYQIEAWARLVNATTGPANLTLKVTCAGTDQFLRVASATASDTAWTLVAGSITIPSCAATEITLYLEGPPAGVDQLIDDVSVRQDFTTVDPNIITNPDFETGTSDWFGFGGPILTSTTAQAHGGTRSLLVTARTASFQGPATSLLAAPAGGYTASGWVRLANATTGEIRLTLKTRCGTTDSYATVGSASVTDTGWTQITGTLTVPSCEPTEVTLYFEGPPAGVELYVDDVVVVAGP
ncbi:MAG: carbohydrate binding domain-containing protein [Kofleriaceae bacterium]